MSTEDIIDFLKTGELTSFPFGTDLLNVTSSLGENEGWSVPIGGKDKRAGLIKYDQTEFYFDSNDIQRLWGVQVTYSEPADKRNFEMNYRELRKEINYDQVKAFLVAHKVSFTEFDEDKVIKTEGEVIFRFWDDNTVAKLGRFIK